MSIVQVTGVIAVAAVLAQSLSYAPTERRADGFDVLFERVEPAVISHRRQLHEHPELANRESETAAYLAQHLRALGLEVETGVAHTGVVAVLAGAQPGRTVALRAEMDALPIVEEADVPYRSKVRTDYDGREVGVMHACAHDGHMAILLGVAQVLAAQRESLRGTVKFIFQPAAETPPAGEDGGGGRMIRDGVLRKDPRPEAIFGLHLQPEFEVGRIGYRAGTLTASADDLRIVVHGRAADAAAPWLGVDAVVVASQIVLGLQTIASRQTVATRAPVSVSIGRIEGGARDSSVSDRVELRGTLRALDEDMRQDLHARVQRTVENLAEAAGARAEVFIAERHASPMIVNDPALLERMLPGLQREFGSALFESRPTLATDEFGLFQREIPGLYLIVGARPIGVPAAQFPASRSAGARIDEGALVTGVRLLTRLAWDYLQQD